MHLDDCNKFNHNKLDSLYNMHMRLGVEGGDIQQNRMIHDKYWSMQHALKYSYQAAKIKKWAHDEICPALINPDKVKQNYDDKILSIGWEYGFKPGDVFEWINTNTLWLVTLQELTELAYFRSEIRRCNYIINWLDQESGETHMIHAAVRGPIETQINYIQKSGISLDKPNYGLSILMPKTEETSKYFRRYAKFYLEGLDEGDENKCWRVEATDSISMPGILQIEAEEFYANEFEDDEENLVAGGLIVKPLKPEEDTQVYIAGPGIVKPKIVNEFIYRGKTVENWSWDSKLPIEVKVDGRKITVKWLPNFGGKFTLKCGNQEKEVIVDSLF